MSDSGCISQVMYIVGMLVQALFVLATKRMILAGSASRVGGNGLSPFIAQQVV